MNYGTDNYNDYNKFNDYEEEDRNTLIEMAGAAGAMSASALHIFQHEAERIMEQTKQKANEIQNESVQYAEKGMSPY